MKNHKEIKIFLISFVILLIYGILLSYNYKIESNYNLLFDSDTGRVIIDATEMIENHYRLSVHPLFILLIQPLVFLLKGITLNKMISIIVLSALASSLSVVYLYKILSINSKNEKLNTIISLIYLFSFSNIIFTSGIETYNFATLFLLVLWYYYLKKQNENYNFYSYVMLVILGVLSAGFTITNFTVFLIVIFLLFVNKKVKITKLIIIVLVTILSVIGLNIGQKIIWRNTQLIWRISPTYESSFATRSIQKENIKNVLLYDYYNSLISSDIKVKVNYGNSYQEDNYQLVFKDISIMNFLLLSSFYIFLIILLGRNFKKNKNINIGLLLTLLFNTLLHLFYGNNSPFLYSLHFIYLIVLLFGINLLTEENQKLRIAGISFSMLFMITEIINNNYIFLKILKYVNEIIDKNPILAYLGHTKMILLELLAIAFILGIIIILKKLIKVIKIEEKEEKRYSYIILFIILLSGIELLFVFVENKNQVINKKFEGNGVVSAPSAENYLSADFKQYFKKELKSLNKYQEEIETLKKEYKTTPSAKIAYQYFYYFGMANRRKLLYIENEIKDIETKQVLYKFKVDEIIIVPNEYSVLIKTVEKDFIKIYEDKNGVHLNKNGKDEIIKGTDVPIDLYSFDGYKYKTILKELYGELLFNIKDGVIYPNIIVYEKPWYRDAALTCMVLQQTQNTDLVKDWVLNIEEIYDKQNQGINEPDNLGELLYIISTQDERNEDLIDKIETEAYRLAESNENGYYIYGETDSGNMFLYQNLWYKLGIESVGRKFKFDLSSIPMDEYTKMAWWSDYPVEDDSYEVSALFPYLSYAMRHKLGNGTIPINDALYPQSVEINALEAKYHNYNELDSKMIEMNASPLHAWAASELMLLLMANN